MSVNIKALERQENDLYMRLDELDAKRAETDRLLVSKKAELMKVQNRLKHTWMYLVYLTIKKRMRG